MRRIWFGFILMLMLAACQGTAATPFPQEFNEQVNLGDYALKLRCAGEGEPTLIFEDNLLGSWSAITLNRFKTISRACIYERYSIRNNSGEKISGARTALDQANDLHNLLQTAGVPGPYILIAHGTGGWNALLYTDQYPKEVAGLVCVDCVPPGVWRTFFEKLETEPVETTAAIQQEIESFRLIYEDYNSNLEHLDLAESSNLAEKVSELGDRPFVVLAVPPIDPSDADPAEVLIDTLWHSLDQKMCNLSSRCRYAVAAGATDMTILNDKTVDAVVREVYEAAVEK